MLKMALSTTGYIDGYWQLIDLLDFNNKVAIPKFIQLF